MQTVATDISPFFVLWQFFLVFFGVVLLVNIISVIVTALLKRRVASLYKTRGKRGKA